MNASVVAILAAIIPALATAAEPDGLALEEIIVTAQKRAQSLQDVPISVSVIDGDLLSTYAIHDFNEAWKFIPNVNYEEGTEGAAIIIRGFGNSGGTNFGFDSPVGTFIDGVYHGRLNQTRLAFMDLERIEVLRGPQSTLFGMNSVGGAISVISRQPTDTLEGSIDVRYDPKYENGDLNAVISGPLTDTLSARLAVMKSEEDGYLYNTVLDRDFGGIDDDAARLTLRWEPTEAFTLSTKFEYGKRFQDGVNKQLLTPPNSAATITAMRALDPDITFTPDDLNESNNGNFRELRSKEGVLTADYAFGPATLTSISAYTEFREDSSTDLSSLPLTFGQIRAIEDFDQVSQELRIVSTGPRKLDYLAGLYYQRSTEDHKRPLDFILGNFVPALANTPSGPLQTYAGDFEQTYRTVAAFGQASWHMTDDLQLMLGGRYSEERKDASSYFDWLRPGSTGAENTLTPGTPEWNAANFVFNTIFRIVRHQDSGRYDEDSFLPEAKLLWDATENINLYAAWGKGEKAGGFNDRDNRGVNFDFNPEKSTNYEIGTKMRLLDGRAQLDATVFRTEFTDMQISVFDLASLIFIVDNAARATTQGIELEGAWRISESFLLNGAVGWLETAQFDEFLVQCVADPMDPTCVVTPSGSFRNTSAGGIDLNTPTFSGTLGFQFTRQFGESRTLNLRADVNHRGKSEDKINVTGPVDSVTFLDFSIAASAAQGWNYGLVIKNVTDERAILTRRTSLTAGMMTGEVSPPRTIAVQIGYSFN